MEFVIVEAANWYVMDKEHAVLFRHLLEVQRRDLVDGNYYGASYQEDAIEACLKTANVLEATRDKRAIAILKANYKEVF